MKSKKLDNDLRKLWKLANAIRVDLNNRDYGNGVVDDKKIKRVNKNMSKIESLTVDAFYSIPRNKSECL